MVHASRERDGAFPLPLGWENADAGQGFPRESPARRRVDRKLLDPRSGDPVAGPMARVG